MFFLAWFDFIKKKFGLLSLIDERHEKKKPLRRYITDSIQREIIHEPNRIQFALIIFKVS